MPNSIVNRAGQICAYFFGVALIFFGILGLITGFGKEEPSFHPLAGHVFDVSLTVCGLFACITTWMRYGGGFVSILGTLLVGGGLTTTTTILEANMRGEHFRNPATFYIKAAVFVGIGGCFLVWGHIRHRKKKSSLP